MSAPVISLAAERERRQPVRHLIVGRSAGWWAFQLLSLAALYVGLFAMLYGAMGIFFSALSGFEPTGGVQ